MDNPQIEPADDVVFAPGHVALPVDFVDAYGARRTVRVLASSVHAVVAVGTTGTSGPTTLHEHSAVLDTALRIFFFEHADDLVADTTVTDIWVPLAELQDCCAAARALLSPASQQSAGADRPGFEPPSTR